MKLENLRSLRVAKGLNQTQFATCIGVSQQRYQQYESGKREPDNDTLLIIANELNTTTDYLLGLSDNPNPPVTKNLNQPNLYQPLNSNDIIMLAGLTDDDKKKIVEYAELLRAKRERGE